MTPGSIGPVKKETTGKEKCLYVLAVSPMLADYNSCSKLPLIRFASIREWSLTFEMEIALHFYNYTVKFFFSWKLNCKIYKEKQKGWPQSTTASSGDDKQSTEHSLVTG